MDLQLEWMKLEDFQKHLDGEDENFTTAEAIPSSEYFWNYGDPLHESRYVKPNLSFLSF